MSSSAMGRTDPEAPPDLEAALAAVLDRCTATTDRLGGVLAVLEAGECPSPDTVTMLQYVLAELVEESMELRALQDDAPRRTASAHLVALLTWQQQRIGQLEAEAQARQVPKHRKPRDPSRQRPLWQALPGGLAGFIPASLAAFRHTAAHHAVAAKAAAAALIVGVPAAAVTGAVVIGAAGTHHRAAGWEAGSVTKGAHVQEADPILTPAQRKPVAAVTHPAQGKHRPALTTSSSSLLYTPASTPTSSQPSASSASTGPVEGTLVVPVTSIQGDPATGATIELDASGGAVPWGAVCESGPCQDVTLSAYHGSLADGGQAFLSVTFDAAAQASGGTVVFRFAPGDTNVTVTWPAAPPPAVPTVAPQATTTPAADPSLPAATSS